MSKWVTFYEEMVSGIHDLVIHDSKEDAIAYFKNHYGCDCLWVNADNERAIHVYEKNGYKVS